MRGLTRGRRSARTASFLALAGLALASAGRLFAQDAASVTARLEPSRIALGETVDLVVEIEPPGLRTRIGEPELPELPVAVVGQSRESQVLLDGGDLTRRIAYRYRLRPLASGTVTIDPIRVVVDGRSLYTPTLELVVDREAAGGAEDLPRLGTERAAPSGAPPFFVTTRVDRERARVGEQITLTFAFYHDPRVPLAESPDYDPPATPGFWRLEIDREPLVGTERIGRRAYHVQRFRYALFPLRAGELTIGPATVRVVQPDPDRWWRAGKPRALRTDPLRIRAESLPPDAPAGFDGAVGRYDLVGGVARDRATVGVPLQLELTVDGVGNPTAVGAPMLPAWPDVAVQPPEIQTQTEVRDARVHGRATFRYLLSPQVPGRLDLGAARFAYFDPSAEQYAVDTIALGEIKVASPRRGEPGVAASRARRPPGPTLWTAREPRRPGPVALAGEVWYWAALAGPWVAWLAALAGSRARRRILARQTRLNPVERIARARARLTAGEAGAVIDALRGIEEALFETRRAGEIPPEVARAAIEARELLRAAAYSDRPVAGAESALVALEAAFRKTRRRGRRHIRAHFLAALTFTTLGVGTGFAGPGDAARLWQAANRAYRAGDFARAAEGYRMLLREHSDPRLEADLAAALWRAGQRGPAVVHYRRALDLAPRSGTIRKDLDRLEAELGHPPQAESALGGLTSRVRLDELLLLLLAANGLAFLLALTARRWHRARAPATGATLLVVLLASATALLAARPGFMARDRAVVTRVASVTASRGGQFLATLPEGSVVEVLERRPAAWRVRAPDVPAGWVASDRLIALDSTGDEPVLRDEPVMREDFRAGDDSIPR